ncbi:hypothetical protein BC670_2037 [Flavobacterium branchiophilum]|uniref:Uncharacterized protein n=1 Tax=Flavobacterium branchiophilum TaxID=55197 RepID=A0A543G4U0_9FLAO|nr:hypothetical protein BC670_2037 [Flavobacterium branchiophilum]
MKTLNVSLEKLETRELATVAVIVDKCGTTTTNGNGNTVIVCDMCCCTCCC